VVQFIDFGARLLTQTRDIYRSPSGHTHEAVKLSVVASDLTQLVHNIELQSASLPRSGRGTSNEILLRICAECQDVSLSLQRAIGELRIHEHDTPAASTGFGAKFDRGFQSFAAALREIWSSNDIHILQVRLAELRSQLTAASLALLSEQSTCGTDQLVQLSRQQQENTEKILDRINNSANALLEGAAKSSMDACSESVTHIPSSLFLSSGRKDTPSQHAGAIIDSLYFRSSDTRRHAISAAHQETFQWIFEQAEHSNRKGAQWSDFLSWMDDDSPEIYWVTGKPGSGKSTLMKFLIEHAKVREHLTAWAKMSEKPLVLASFYLWSAGAEEMQKSQKGLLQALLAQILSQVSPHIASLICPRRWAFFSIFGTAHQLPPWTTEELLESFATLGMVGDKFSLVVFIDGLDEMDGDHKTLIDCVRHLHSRQNTKVCVSSRPWNVFVDAFSRNPSLKMEDLTAHDISAYVDCELGSTPAYLELKDDLPMEAEALVEEVVRKANGVFLWVTLVVRELCDGLADGNNLQAIRSILDSLPSGLSNLYDKLWASVMPQYAQEALCCFVLCRCAQLFLGNYFLTLFLATFEDPAKEYPSLRKQQSLSFTRKFFIRWLRSRTRGLLEMDYLGHVDCLHRTVHSWFSKNRLDFSPRMSPDFDPYLTLFKASVIATMFETDPSPPWPAQGIRGDFKVAVTETFAYYLDAYPGMVQPSLAEWSQSKDDPTVVEFMDIFSTVFDKEAQNVGPRIYYIDFSNVDTDSTDIFPPPWPWTDLPQSFLGVACQLGVYSYVRDKVRNDPGLLRWTPTTYSIFSSAVFDLAPQFACRKVIHCFLPARLVLVQFLVEFGALRTPLAHQQEFSREVCTWWRWVCVHLDNCQDDGTVGNTNRDQPTWTEKWEDRFSAEREGDPSYWCAVEKSQFEFQELQGVPNGPRRKDAWASKAPAERQQEQEYWLAVHGLFEQHTKWLDHKALGRAASSPGLGNKVGPGRRLMSKLFNGSR